MKLVKTQLEEFVDQGYVSLGEIINKEKCQQLLQYIKSTRDFSEKLFIEEDDFRANPQYRGVNPRPGQNILENIDLSFVESNEIFQSLLSELLGNEYSIIIKKVVCGVPKIWMPEWLIKETNNLPVANLGSYIKPEYRDITYFRGIDFHQDIIDYKNRISDFITLYVYLDEVTERDSPLLIIPGSHIFGATTFPHNLVRIENSDNDWQYSDNQGNSKILPCQTLTGSTGSVWFWHPCFLHGTQPTTSSRCRISLRYIIAKSSTAESTFLDYVNSTIKAPLSLENTRVDVNEYGVPIMRGNIINGKT